MADVALVGDIGGTNSRFGLVTPGSTDVHDIKALKNDSFASLEAAARHYVATRGLTKLAATAIAIAAPVAGETLSLTNRDWTFTRTDLRRAVNAEQLVMLNDFEVLAWSLPHLKSDELFQIGGETPSKAGVKIVLGPGTGLGMAALAPLPGGGWMPIPGELGHVTLPVTTQEEFDLRAAMATPGIVFEAEDAITGTGLPRIYRAVCARLGEAASIATSEEILAAGLAGNNAAARQTLDHFCRWLALLAGDAAMTLQAYGGVYLASSISATIKDHLKSSDFRRVFEEKGRLAHVMRPIPIYVVTAKFPALTGCAAALAAKHRRD